MRVLCQSAAAMLCALFCASALGAASITLRLTGDDLDETVSVDSSGTNYANPQFGISLAPGQTAVESFTYSITVANDLLPAQRDWSFCTPILQTDCGPAPTGFEQAYGSIFMGRDPRQTSQEDQYIVDYALFEPSGTTGRFSVDDDFLSPTPITYTGTVEYVAENTSDLFYQAATVYVMVAGFVDASTIPEPSPMASLLAGVAVLFAVQRRRQAPRARA